MADRLCICGCGRVPPIAKQTIAKLGIVKGEPKIAVRGHRRRTPIEERFWKKVQKGDGCWSWTGSRHRFGYGMINVRGLPVTAHRVSYELNVGPIPEGLSVLHSCDNPPCTNPAHLFLGTHLDNMRDAVQKGRFPRGPQMARAKLSESLVREIRAALAAGGRVCGVAREFGIGHRQVSRIAHRKVWAWVA